MTTNTRQGLRIRILPQNDSQLEHTYGVICDNKRYISQQRFYNSTCDYKIFEVNHQQTISKHTLATGEIIPLAFASQPGR